MKRMIIASAEIPSGVLNRMKQATSMVMKCYNAATEDYYEEADGEKVYSEPDTKDPKKDWDIYKGWLLYTSSYDENDKRVKQGGRVPGSTYYTVTLDGDTYDETNFACLTLEDAKKCLNIYREWEADRYRKLSNRGGN